MRPSLVTTEPRPGVGFVASTLAQMRTLYVVTHAEATHHLDGLVGGWFDSALTDKGHADAHKAASALRARIPVDEGVELLSSDLQRAQQTGAAISESLGTDVHLVPGLRECSFGEAEGRPKEWLDERFVRPPARGGRMDHEAGIPGYETRRQVAERIYKSVEEILDRPAGHQVLVTHGGALTFVVACWIRMPIDAAGHIAVSTTSGSITELQEDDHFHNRWITRLNDVSHLASP